MEGWGGDGDGVGRGGDTLNKIGRAVGFCGGKGGSGGGEVGALGGGGVGGEGADVAVEEVAGRGVEDVGGGGGGLWMGLSRRLDGGGGGREYRGEGSGGE